MNTAPAYASFLSGKSQLSGEFGFEPLWTPDFLFPFQRCLVEWAVRRGRGAIFADCGLGKTPMQLVWAQNVIRRTNRPVLLLAPLGVVGQTVAEGEKFGVECVRARDGKFAPGARVVVTNYDQLHKFDPADFAGAVGDESACIKDFESDRTGDVIEFLRELEFRLLATATPSPNDFIELGTHSEALGDMGYQDMLSRFFKNDNRGVHPNSVWGGGGWRFRGHAERDYWRWVVSWARPLRRPSDLGFSDDGYELPPLLTEQHTVQARFTRPDRLFDTLALTAQEQNEERRRTLKERCEKAASLVSDTGEPAVSWCHLNAEGDLLARLIPDAVQVSGADPDERKEEVFRAFAAGEVRVLVTKPAIAGYGLNWQHCAHMTFFPSHSHERYYQCVRRCWRFGQKRPVRVGVVTSEGEANVLANLERKSAQADRMFALLAESVGDELRVERANRHTKEVEVPAWLS